MASGVDGSDHWTFIASRWHPRRKVRNARPQVRKDVNGGVINGSLQQAVGDRPRWTRPSPSHHLSQPSAEVESRLWHQRSPKGEGLAAVVLAADQARGWPR